MVIIPYFRKINFSDFFGKNMVKKTQNTRVKGESLFLEKRSFFGRKVKRLRKEGIIPGNIFGKNLKSLAVQFSLKDFETVYKSVGETGLVKLETDKETYPALIHGVQSDPATGNLLHVDFLKVDLKEKVTAPVPIETMGISPAEKQGLGTVVLYIDEVEVEALPADLPEKFGVDISTLTEVDQAIFVKDLQFDKEKVEIKADPETILVKVEPPEKEEEVPVPTEEAVAEGEAPAEGEVPAETEGGKEQSPQKEEEKRGE